MGLYTLPSNRNIYCASTGNPLSSGRLATDPTDDLDKAFNLAHEQGGEVTIWIAENDAIGVSGSQSRIEFDHNVGSRVRMRIWDGATPQGAGNPASPTQIYYSFKFIDTILDIGPGFIFDRTADPYPKFDLRRSYLTVENCQILGGTGFSVPVFDAHQKSKVEWIKTVEVFVGAGNIDHSTDSLFNDTFIINSGSQLEIIGDPATQVGIITKHNGIILNQNSNLRIIETSLVKAAGASLARGIQAEHGCDIVLPPAASPSTISAYDVGVSVTDDGCAFIDDASLVTLNNIGIQVESGAKVDYTIPPAGNVTDTSAPGPSIRLRGYV